MSKKLLAWSLVLTAFAAFAAPLAFAGDTPSWIMDTSGVGKDDNGVIRSNQLLELGTAPSSALQLEGENAMRMGHIESALTALQRSVEMSPLDMDKRTLYAEALEKKLVGQKEKDPKLFNYVVKQWLFIYRKAEYVDQTLQARAHLLRLTGTHPKPFERSANFLGRVMVPEDGSAKVALGKKPVTE